MKDVLRYVAVLVFTFLVLFGLLAYLPSAPQHVQNVYESNQPQVVVECLDDSLTKFVPAWKTEVARRWHEPCVMILCHGGELCKGEWVVKVNEQIERTDDLVIEMQRKYPNRTLILLACNPGHLALKEHGVWHSQDSTWCIPDRAVTPADFSNGLATETLWNLPQGNDNPDDQPVPATQPAYDPEDEQPQSEPTGPTRWQLEPDITGNAYELIAD